MKLLCADDSLTIRRIISDAAETVGMETYAVEDGEKALGILRTHADEIAVILLDWNMPGLNGLEVLQRIKATPGWRDIPVMMVTTESERTSILAAIKSGANNYLTKPFSSEDLIMKIMQCLGQGS